MTDDERKEITDWKSENGFTISQAAQALGVSYDTFKNALYRDPIETRVLDRVRLCKALGRYQRRKGGGKGKGKKGF